MKIMVVEDEVKVLNFIKRGLSSAEFTVDTAKNLDELFSNLLSSQYDIIVLDRLLGGTDAIKYILEIRKKAPDVKIIVLSALSETDEKVQGLTAGADDYLGKPFHLSELIARIRALLRRSKKEHVKGGNKLSYHDLTVQLDSQKVERNNIRIDLTPKEYKLLVFLMARPNKIFSKTVIINDVWELQHYPESNVVEVVVNHLRNKIDKDFDRPLIHSRRSVGYWFGDPDL